MMVFSQATCFICGKPFGGEVIARAIAGAPPGREVLVDEPCFEQIVEIETADSCSQLAALLSLSARVQGALLGRAARKEAHHA